MGQWDKYKKNKPEKNDSNTLNNGMGKTVINWYPGHMAKTKRLISENLNLIDIVYEVIDARIPRSSKIEDIDSLLKNKPKILIMTKYDLCDTKETDKFIKYYESLGYKVLKYNLNSNESLDQIFTTSKELLKEKLIKKQGKGYNSNKIRALVVGIPNVGKSSLINKIAKKNKVVVGNKPGVTKNIGWVKATNEIEIMDSPGILWPKLEQGTTAYNLAATTAIKEEILPLDDVSVYIIKTLYKYYPEILKEQYGIDNIDDFIEVFEIIGRKKGFLSRGGIVDDDKVVHLIINDIKSGKIKGITFDRM